METKLAPLAMPCNIPMGHSYLNPVGSELEHVCIKDLKWFVNQIGGHVYVRSHSYSGIAEIHDHDQAKQLYNNQFEGYSFLTLQDRMKQASKDVYYDQSQAFQEPELEKIYLLAIHENGILKESYPVVYSGFSHNLKWYVFNFLNGTDSAGNSCHLLKVGYFPAYQNSSNPKAVAFEQYIPLS